LVETPRHCDGRSSVAATRKTRKIPIGAVGRNIEQLVGVIFDIALLLDGERPQITKTNVS
jgi:hypothetical protein